MKRWILYTLVAAGFLLLPKGQGVDIGKLIPTELIYIYKDQDRIVVETDTGNSGEGITLEKALEDLHATASGTVFLDTVQYALVTEDTKDLLPELESVLRLSTNVILATADVDPAKTALYLTSQNPEVTLKDHLTQGEHLPKIMKAGERYYIE